jgi:hypothetical protein
MVADALGDRIVHILGRVRMALVGGMGVDVINPPARPSLWRPLDRARSRRSSESLVAPLSSCAVALLFSLFGELDGRAARVALDLAVMARETWAQCADGSV